jgi:hypothetical protein
MLDQTQKPRSFGVDDKPSYPNCGKRLSLTGRGPHIDYELRYERQIFTCFGCDQEFDRIIEAEGNNPD